MTVITRTLASGSVAVIDPATNKVTTILPPRKALSTTATPKVERETCHACNGSGLFYMGGATVNGVYTGKTGPCFRCEGKGYQTEADVKRNNNYDRYYRRVYI